MRWGFYGGVTPSNPTIIVAEVYLLKHGAETDDLFNFLLLGLSFAPSFDKSLSVPIFLSSLHTEDEFSVISPHPTPPPFRLTLSTDRHIYIQSNYRNNPQPRSLAVASQARNILGKSMGNTRYMSVPMRSIVHVLVLYIETKVLLMYVAMCEKLSNPQCGGAIYRTVCVYSYK